ncbi:hypothetical protein FRC17_002746 [Serendipita sp. 399]|nr:hypothetical protein FRC17_002746 [Serendipita sp. 399]
MRQWVPDLILAVSEYCLKPPRSLPRDSQPAPYPSWELAWDASASLTSTVEYTPIPWTWGGAAQPNGGVSYTREQGKLRCTNVNSQRDSEVKNNIDIETDWHTGRRHGVTGKKGQ